MTKIMNLDALKSSVLAGSRSVTAEDLRDAYFNDMLAELRLEASQIAAAAQAEIIASADTEFASFLADALAVEGMYRLKLPIATVYTTDSTSIEAGRPTVLVTPLASTVHRGDGTASGKAKIELFNIDSALDPNSLRDVVVERVSTRSPKSVQVGNVPFYSVQAEHVVLDNPMVTTPSVTALTNDFLRVAKTLNVGASGYSSNYVYAEAFDPEVLSQKASKVLARGTVAVYQTVNEKMPTDVYAERLTQYIEGTKGFALGLGNIESVAVVDRKPYGVPGQWHGFQLTFEVTAKARKAGQ